MPEKKDLTPHIQDSIAFLAITSTEFLKIVRNALRVDLLPSDPIYYTLKSCYKYFDLIKQAPGDHFCDVLDESMIGVEEKKKDIIFGFVDRISQMKAPNSDYVISRLNEYVKTREFEQAALEFVRLVDRKQFQQAELIMYNALRAGVEKENIGLDYFKDLNFESRRLHKEPIMRLGLKHFDHYRQFHRKELVCVLGGMKGKKSWSGHHFGVQGLLRGLNVLHISHENSEEECEERYDRMAGAIANVNFEFDPVNVRFYDEEHQTLASQKQMRPCIKDSAARKDARRLLQKFGGRLIIKKYPMYYADMREIERYLDYQETFESFVPDLLINDYPDVQKPLDGKKATRDQINETYMYNKRLVDERNMLGLVFSQATRAAIRAKRLTRKDFAEDIRKLANVDTAIGVCQTDAQAKMDIATLFVIAARVGVEDVGCGIVMNLDIGQFASDSFPVKFGVEVADEDKDSSKSKEEHKQT